MNYKTQFVEDPSTGGGIKLSLVLGEVLDRLSPRLEVTAITPVNVNGTTVGVLLTTREPVEKT